MDERTQDFGASSADYGAGVVTEHQRSPLPAGHAHLVEMVAAGVCDAVAVSEAATEVAQAREI